MAKKFLEEDTKLLDTVVDERMAKNSDEILEMRKMFDEMTAKLGVLQSYYKVDNSTRDKVVVDLQKFLKTIGRSYIQQWCLAEESLAVIAHLEAEILKAGLDVEVMRKAYVEANQQKEQ